MKNFNQCNQTLISQYYDKELDKIESASLEAHMKQCKSCQSVLQDYLFVSKFVQQGIEKIASPYLESKILQKTRKKEPSGFWWSNFLTPASVMATVLIFFLTWMYISPSKTSPSAIISYVSGDISSVMIMETPKTRQTILWIQENF